MAEMGRLIALFGVILLVVGSTMALLGRPHLPGDMVLRRNGLVVVVPIATSLLISVILTILLTLLLRAR